MTLTKSHQTSIKAALLTGFLALGFCQTASAMDAASLADGMPWQMTSTSGPNGRITLNSDGTGQMRAFGLRANVSWAADGEELCLTSRMRGTRCVTLVSDGAAINGVEAGETVFTLAR